MKNILSALLIFISFLGNAQIKYYSVSNAHSHNDYRNSTPFYKAFREGFGSIEADVFPRQGKLLVAHDKEDLDSSKTLNSLYLDPILEELSKNPKRKLRLLIDIKENHLEILPILMKALEPLRTFLSTARAQKQLQIVISGNRPKPADFHSYPDYVFFDHDLSVELTPEQARRVGLVSVSFTKFSKWDGVGVLPAADEQRVRAVIDSAHQLKKEFRFWAVPDTEKAWLMQMKLGADVIGTDRIEDLGKMLKRLSKGQH